MPAFGKRTPLTRQPFAEFEAAYGPDPHGKAPRTATGPVGRWQYFSREVIAARGDSLDLAWLRDESAEYASQLPEPADLARAAIDELEGALADLRAILRELGMTWRSWCDGGVGVAGGVDYSSSWRGFPSTQWEGLEQE